MNEYLEAYDQESSDSIPETGQQTVLTEESAQIEEAEKELVPKESAEAVAEIEASPSGEMVLAAASPIQAPTPECPKEYVQSPFSHLSGCETISLNNGSVQHSVTDFVLPGRNGFDLEMVRRYNSFDANTTDLTPSYTGTTMYGYVIKVDGLGYVNRSGQRTSLPNGSIVDFDLTPMSASKVNTEGVKAIAVNEDYFEPGSVSDLTVFKSINYQTGSYSYTDYGLVEITKLRSAYYEIVAVPAVSTSFRENTHLRRTYGLGYGWRFALPSIEIIPEIQYGSSKVAIKEFLHLASGESFEIKNKNTLDKHTLTDVQIQSTATLTLTHPVTGGTVTYNRIVTYKNGNKDYFMDVLVSNVLDSCKLTAQQDRFGNTITYLMTDYGGMTIVDTTGKTVTLVKSGNTLTWNLPDNRKIIYITDGTALTQVNDEISRVTAYEYTSRSAVNRYNSEDYDGNPAGVPITFNYLAAINHPSGARTEYTYPTAPVTLTSGNYGGYTQYFPLGSRKDTCNGVTANKVDYAFTPTGKYISIATVTRNSGAVVETHTFNSDNLCAETTIKHSGTEVSKKAFAYNTDKLVTAETTTKPLVGVKKWEYDNNTTVAADKKGNVTKETVEVSDVVGFPTSLSSTMEYDATYSILTKKTYQRDATNTVIEEYVLTTDKKLVEFEKINEKVGTVTTVKQLTKYAYDANYNLAQEQSYYGSLSAPATYYATAFTYDPATKLPLPLTRTVTGVKDADGADAAGTITAGTVIEKFEYDSFGRTLKHTDANNKVTQFAYDLVGRITKTTYPDTKTKSIVYTDTSNYMTVTDENGKVRQFYYTPLGQINKVYDGAGTTMLAMYEYDAVCRLSKATVYGTSGVKNTTSYTYDNWDRALTKIVNDLQNNELYKETAAYEDSFENKYAKVTKIIAGDADAPELKSTVYTDKLGRVEKQGYFIGATEYFNTFTYDYLGNMLTTQTALDKSRGSTVYSGNWEYDFAGRVVKSTNALGLFAATQYDEIGNIKQTTDYKGNATTYRYDALGRLIEKTAPFDDVANTVVKCYYDAVGNIKKQLSSNNIPGAAASYNRIETTYDACNRPLTVTVYKDADGVANNTDTTIYTYDGVGNKLTVTTAGGSLIQYAYNQYNAVTKITDALNQSDTFTYDAYGVLTSKTDRNGNTTTYTYDALGRVLTETVKDTGSVVTGSLTLAYAKTGAKKMEQNAFVTTSFKYDSLGRLITVTETGDVEKTYGYDIGGNRTSFILKKSGTAQISNTYTYDNLNRLKTVLDTGMTIAIYTYDENGNRATLKSASAANTAYAYNKANLVTKVTNYKGSTTTTRISEYTYEYRLDGNQIKKTDMSGSATKYTYDRIGRLTREEQPDGTSTSYMFDKNGNRQTMTVTGSGGYSVVYTYDLDNRLLKEEKTKGMDLIVTSYQYDKNGNQIFKEIATISPADASKTPVVKFSNSLADVEKLEYNGYNQLVFAFSNGNQASYVYRPDGLRHNKTVNGTTTTHLWDGADIVGEYQGGGILARYLRGTNLIAQKIGSTLYYYLFNAHGDVVQYVNFSGDTQQIYDYDAFGNEKITNTNDPNPFRFCGEYFDSETKTVYLRARNYNPANGRFSASDPIRSGLNWYTYCNGNPVMLVDPAGLSPFPNPNDYKTTIKGNSAPTGGGGGGQSSGQKTVTTTIKGNSAPTGGGGGGQSSSGKNSSGQQVGTNYAGSGGSSSGSSSKSGSSSIPIISAGGSGGYSVTPAKPSIPSTNYTSPKITDILGITSKESYGPFQIGPIKVYHSHETILGNTGTRIASDGGRASSGIYTGEYNGNVKITVDLSFGSSILKFGEDTSKGIFIETGFNTIALASSNRFYSSLDQKITLETITVKGTGAPDVTLRDVSGIEIDTRQATTYVMVGSAIVAAAVFLGPEAANQVAQVFA